MKNFFVGVLQIICATIILNYTLFAQENITNTMKYPEYRGSPVVVPTPTVQEYNDTIVSDGVGFVWSTRELAEQYHSKDYTITYKDRMVKENRPCWLASGDTVKILERPTPLMTKIRILSHKYGSNRVLFGLGICEGWLRY